MILTVLPRRVGKARLAQTWIVIADHENHSAQTLVDEAIEELAPMDRSFA
jgi:hypothetical protein